MVGSEEQYDLIDLIGFKAIGLLQIKNPILFKNGVNKAFI